MWGGVGLGLRQAAVGVTHVASSGMVRKAGTASYRGIMGSKLTSSALLHSEVRCLASKSRTIQATTTTTTQQAVQHGGELRAPINVAVVLERYPLVEPPPTEFEQEYLQFKRQMLYEKSAVSFEEYLTMLKEQEGGSKKKKKKKKDKQGGVDTATDTEGERDDSSQSTSASEVLAAADTSPIEFNPASLETDDDRANKTQSLNRCLAQKLYLVIKPKGESQWQLPQLTISSEGSLRQCAENALACAASEDQDPSDFKTYFIGNAPCVHTVEQQASDDSLAYTFYLRCILVKGKYSPAGAVDDFAWIPHSELPQYLKHADRLQRALYG